MPAETNKALVAEWFEALGKGDGRPMLKAMAPDIKWTISGRSSWSGTFQGLDDLRQNHLGPMFALFGGTYTNTAKELIAEGNNVVVRCRARGTTTGGVSYDNDYCWILRLDGGQLVEVIEYVDTLGVEQDLGAKPG